jgi:hypothetical protein
MERLMTDTAVNDETTIITAEQFAREMDEQAADREFQLRGQEANNRHGRLLALIWAPVVAAIILGFIFLLGFVVHQISTEHGKRVTVWCYADPNRNDATSSFTGSPSDVRGLCPDAR